MHWCQGPTPIHCQAQAASHTLTGGPPLIQATPSHPLRQAISSHPLTQATPSHPGHTLHQDHTLTLVSPQSHTGPWTLDPPLPHVVSCCGPSLPRPTLLCQLRPTDDQLDAQTHGNTQTRGHTDTWTDTRGHTPECTQTWTQAHRHVCGCTCGQHTGPTARTQEAPHAQPTP